MKPITIAQAKSWANISIGLLLLFSINNNIHVDLPVTKLTYY